MDCDESDMVYCPYNKEHKMLRKKLQQHILKCRELYKDTVNLMVCPFNKGHLILEPEYYVSNMINIRHTATKTLHSNSPISKPVTIAKLLSSIRPVRLLLYPKTPSTPRLSPRKIGTTMTLRITIRRPIVPRLT